MRLKGTSLPSCWRESWSHFFGRLVASKLDILSLCVWLRVVFGRQDLAQKQLGAPDGFVDFLFGYSHHVRPVVSTRFVGRQTTQPQRCFYYFKLITKAEIPMATGFKIVFY